MGFAAKPPSPFLISPIPPYDKKPCPSIPEKRAFLIPMIQTLSLNFSLKQICISDLAGNLLIICIIGKAYAIRFFVAILLPQLLCPLPTRSGQTIGCYIQSFIPLEIHLSKSDFTMLAV